MEVPLLNYYAQKCVDFVPFPGALGGEHGPVAPSISSYGQTAMTALI